MLNYPGEFAAKERGRNDHPRVVSAPVHFDVGTAGECDLHLDEDLTVVEAGNRHSFDLHVLFAIEDGSCHLFVHDELPSQALPG